MSPHADARPSSAGSAGKYLTFQLGGGHFGIEILKVREIIGIITITSVPRTPEHVMGVINLRGKVIPVVDLRRKFGMEAAAVTDETCTIVAQLGDEAGGGLEVGVLVDRVSEVLDIDAGQIAPPPAFGHGAATEYILGMGKVGERVVILLDIDRVLEAEALEPLCAATC